MRSIHRLFLIAVPGLLLAGVIAACSTAGPAQPSPAPSATPAPFTIRAAAQAPQACMDALLGGKLTKNQLSGLGVTSADGATTPVEWPFRYSARNNAGVVELLDETGKVVAREGDAITLGGGFGNLVWHACAPVSRAQGAG